MNRHTGENKYALGEIVGVAEGKHKAYNLKEYEYPHKGSGKWTNKWLLLRYGRDERAFMIAEVSNSPVTDAEYGAWRAQLEKDGVKFPQLRDINAAQSNIKAAQDYRIHVRGYPEDAQQASGEEVGAATKPGVSEGEHSPPDRAREDGRRRRGGRQPRGADGAGHGEAQGAAGQGRNRGDDGGDQQEEQRRQRRELSRIASEQVARAKSGAADQSANDPFSRRPTKAATYYAIGKGKEEGAEEGRAKPKTPAAVKTAGAGADAARAPKTPRAGLNSYSVAARVKRDVIVRAHDVDVSVHPALAGGEDPMLSKGLRKGLIPVLRRAMLGGRGLLAADTRAAPVKTLSLHEYKARLDQMDE